MGRPEKKYQNKPPVLQARSRVSQIIKQTLWNLVPVSKGKEAKLLTYSFRFLRDNVFQFIPLNCRFSDSRGTGSLAREI